MAQLMNNQLTEQSGYSIKNALIWMLGIAFFFLMMLFTVIKWVYWGLAQPVELFFEGMFVLILLERAMARYTYEADRNCMRLTKKSAWGVRTYVIHYKDIIGIYHYQPKLLGLTQFRRTYRLHCALDGNPAVWTLAYKAVNKNGTKENRRIYFKPSDAMIKYLRERCPALVLPEEPKDC